MSRTDITPAVSRRKPMRRWLAIELSAYALVCVLLVTTAWEHGNASNAATFAVWTVAAGFVALVVGGIYRRHSRSHRSDQASGSAS